MLNFDQAMQRINFSYPYELSEGMISGIRTLWNATEDKDVWTEAVTTLTAMTTLPRNIFGTLETIIKELSQRKESARLNDGLFRATVEGAASSHEWALNRRCINMMMRLLNHKIINSAEYESISGRYVSGYQRSVGADEKEPGKLNEFTELFYMELKGLERQWIEQQKKKGASSGKNSLRKAG
jgi:hypothetical protein